MWYLWNQQHWLNKLFFRDRSSKCSCNLPSTTSNGSPHLSSLYPFPNIIYAHSSPGESRNLRGQGKWRQIRAELSQLCLTFPLTLLLTLLPDLPLDLVNPLELKWARPSRSLVPLLTWPLSGLYLDSAPELYSLTSLPSWLLLNHPLDYIANLVLGIVLSLSLTQPMVIFCVFYPTLGNLQRSSI